MPRRAGPLIGKAACQRGGGERRGYSCESGGGKARDGARRRGYAGGMKTSGLLVLSAAVALALPLAQAQTPALTPRVSDIPAPGQLMARPAPAPPPAPTARPALLVPAGTPIALQLETQLNTQWNGYGDGFAARVMKTVFYQGREVIPSGSILEGHVMHVEDARPVKGQSELLLKPDLLTLPNGGRYTISAVVIQDDARNAARVDSEGMLHEPRGMMTSDVRHLEIGGAGGFIGGAVLAGGQGAMVGAGLGAAVAVGIWLVRRRHLVLNPGSQLTVRLQRPIELSAPAAAPQG